MLCVVNKRVMLTVEPGSRVIVSPEQYTAAGDYIYEEEPDSKTGKKGFFLTEESHKLIFGKLTVAELSRIAEDAGVDLPAGAGKPVIVDILAAAAAGSVR